MAGIMLGGSTPKLLSPLNRSTTGRGLTTPKLYCSMTRDTLPKSSSPWLRLPKDMSTPSMCVDNFLNLVTKHLVKLNIADSYWDCIGSSRGSLAYLTGSQDYYMYTVNPYTGYSQQNYRYMNLSDHSNLHLSTRCFTLVDDVLTVLIDPWLHLDTCTPINHVEFFCLCDVDIGWTRYPYLFHKDDPPIAYCAATKKAYKLSGDSENHFYLELWNLLAHPMKVKSRFPVTTHYTTMEASERELRARCHQDKYLVVTEGAGKVDPGLYLIIRHHNRELSVSQTRAVDVFKFDLVERKLTQTTKLDGHAFFIGKGSDPFAIKVNTCPELKTDSIYISDDLRVFDLKDRSVTPFVEMGDLSMTRPQSFWVAPSSPEPIN